MGFGTSQRRAKMAAAEQVLKTLLPGLRFDKEHNVVDDR